MKRGAPSAKKSATRIKRVTPERAAERREYSALHARYLREHPVCQLWIAEHGLDEKQVLAEWRMGNDSGTFLFYKGERPPVSQQIHHRNKCRGARLTDERWVMALSPIAHEKIESQKAWARERGYLLPIQANAEGAWGFENQALTTPELMASKVKPVQKIYF